jgi:hypothetical protein
MAVRAYICAAPSGARAVVEHIVFACESFDLARHQRQEELLRRLILGITGILGPGRVESSCGVAKPTRELMKLLCAGFSLESYYNRSAPLTPSQHDRFRSVVRHLWEHAAARTYSTSSPRANAIRSPMSLIS